MSDQTESIGDDEGQGSDSPIINDLRKQLKAAKQEAKLVAEENVSFRTARSQARLNAVEKAVNGLSYPKTLVESLKVQVEDLSDDEFAAVLADLQAVAGDGEPTSNEGTPETQAPETPLVNPAELGQQVAAAATGQAGETDAIKRLAQAKTPAELAAVAAELGLDKF